MKKCPKIIMVALLAIISIASTAWISSAPTETTTSQRSTGKRQSSRPNSKATKSKSSQSQYDWIYGTWVCNGTIDMGPYLGGRQSFNTKVIITKTNLKVYYNGDLAYNGSYKIERGEIRYNQTKGTCDVLSLDSVNKRIEFGQGYYYHKKVTETSYKASETSRKVSETSNKVSESPSNNSSYSSVSSSEKVYESVDQDPMFPGGQAALLYFVASHIKYPEVAQENNIQGRVTVKFVITKTGSVGQVKVVRGIDPELDKEAVRVVKSLPKFTPGKMNGRPVNVWYTLPITFKLEN